MGATVQAAKFGRRAMLVGAGAQALPDIDTVTALWLDPASSVVAHRYLTHSVSFALVAGLVLGWVCHRLVSREMSFGAWVGFLWLQLGLHLFLDSFNVYGISWAAPFRDDRVSINALYVADPFLSVPLLIAAIAAWVKWEHRKRWAALGIFTTSVYLAYALFNKNAINRTIDTNLAAMYPSRHEYVATPTPFNVWLWYVVVKTDDGFLIGYHSVFDTQTKIDFEQVRQKDSLLLPFQQRPDVQKLKHFSKGYYAAHARGDTLVFSDVRFGQIHGWLNPHSSFSFYYYVTPPTADNLTVMQRGRAKGWTPTTIKKMALRIFGRKGSDI